MLIELSGGMFVDTRLELGFLDADGQRRSIEQDLVITGAMPTLQGVFDCLELRRTCFH